MRIQALPILFAGVALGATPDNSAPSWFAPATPGVERLDRADMGVAGEAEPGGPLVDGLANGSRSWTGMGLCYQTDQGKPASGEWRRDLGGFDLQAVLGGEQGMAFAMQALDLQPRPSLRAGDVRWKVEEPQGGLRLGVGADALRPWRTARDWTWAVAFWIPVYSPVLDWELQTALVRKRSFRLDLSLAWNEPSVPSILEKDEGDSTLSDTLLWRTQRTRWSARLGFSPVEGLAAQVWGGWRVLHDPGVGNSAGWRLTGSTWFAGTQATLALGDWTLDGEVRGESGNESARFDTVAGEGWTLPSATTGEAEHALADGRLEARGPTFRIGEGKESRSFQPLVGVQGAWMRLDGTGPAGQAVPWDADARFGEQHRWEGHAGWVASLPWFSLEGRWGFQYRELEGNPPRLWWATPAGPGKEWSSPWQARIFRNTESGSSLSYRMSGEVHLSGSTGYSAGLRHEAHLGQEF